MDNELLQKYVEGTISTAEIATVVAWLDADEANVREFMALHKLYNISILSKRFDKQVVAEKKKRRVIRKLSLKLAKIAAILVLAWSTMWLLQPNKPEPESTATWQTLFVPAGQRAELTLADSTKVWVNAQSRLEYPTHFEKGQREIRLDGEAYFEVTYKKEQPFIVKTKTMDIQVLGTEFNVTAYSSHLVSEVSLLKGSIEIKPAGAVKAYLMKINESVRWKEGKLFVSNIRDYDYFRWREGLICFNNETVGDIIETLQLYFDVSINIQKDNLLQYRYTGKFRTKDGVEQVLRVLQLEHRFTYTKDNNLNLITIK